MPEVLFNSASNSNTVIFCYYNNKHTWVWMFCQGAYSTCPPWEPWKRVQISTSLIYPVVVSQQYSAVAVDCCRPMWHCGGRPRGGLCDDSSRRGPAWLPVTPSWKTMPVCWPLQSKRRKTTIKSIISLRRILAIEIWSHYAEKIRLLAVVYERSHRTWHNLDCLLRIVFSDFKRVWCFVETFPPNIDQILKLVGLRSDELGGYFFNVTKGPEWATTSPNWFMLYRIAPIPAEMSTSYHRSAHSSKEAQQVRKCRGSKLPLWFSIIFLKTLAAFYQWHTFRPTPSRTVGVAHLWTSSRWFHRP